MRNGKGQQMCACKIKNVFLWSLVVCCVVGSWCCIAYTMGWLPFLRTLIYTGTLNESRSAFCKVRRLTNCMQQGLNLMGILMKKIDKAYQMLGIIKRNFTHLTKQFCDIIQGFSSIPFRVCCMCMESPWSVFDWKTGKSPQKSNKVSLYSEKSKIWGKTKKAQSTRH